MGDDPRHCDNCLAFVRLKARGSLREGQEHCRSCMQESAENKAVSPTYGAHTSRIWVVGRGFTGLSSCNNKVRKETATTWKRDGQVAPHVNTHPACAFLRKADSNYRFELINVLLQSSKLSTIPCSCTSAAHIEVFLSASKAILRPYVW